MKKILLIIYFSSLLLGGEATENKNKSNIKDINTTSISIKYKQIEDNINNNIWSKIYNNYIIYKDLKKEELTILNKIKKINKKKKKSKKDKKILLTLNKDKVAVRKKLDLITNYNKENDPFKEIITPPVLKNIPTIDNPITIIEAITFKKNIKKKSEDYFEKYRLLKKIIKDLKTKRKFLKDTSKIDEEILIFESVLDVFTVSKNSFIKKTEEINFKIKEEINNEISKTIDIGQILLGLILLIIFIKIIAKHFLIENNRFYMINKFINIIFVTIVIIILLSSYIENVDYLITILGFASAGIAIAMKDWFMSLMGWVVIIIGNSVHVGDRVKFVREGIEYVGDIIDISLLRITIQEDITLTTITTNRRAGRIIFIPNNYIFTDMIANYSHAELKTVWDGIDIIFTFDSDIDKASLIIKEVIKKYSKGYTDITRKGINKMRGQYSIKNTLVEPRVYASIEPYGVRVSGWYLTNSFSTLTLRSTITIEILKKIKEEENIKVEIAYPTQRFLTN